MKKFLNMLVRLWSAVPANAMPKMKIAVVGDAAACVQLTNVWINRATREHRRGALYSVPPFETTNIFWESKFKIDGKWHEVEVWPVDALIKATDSVDDPLTLLIVLGSDAKATLKNKMTAARQLASKYKHVKASVAFIDHQCFGDRALDDPRLFRTSEELDLLNTISLTGDAGRAAVQAVERHLARLEKTILPRWQIALPLVEMLATNRVGLINVYALSSQADDVVPGKDLPLDRWGVDEVLLDSIEFSRDRLRRRSKIGWGTLAAAAAVALGSTLFAWHHGAPAAEIRHFDDLVKRELGPVEAADTPLGSLGHDRQGTPLVPEARMLKRLNELMGKLCDLSNAVVKDAKPEDSVRLLKQVHLCRKKLDSENLHPREAILFDPNASDPQYRRVLRQIDVITVACGAAVAAVSDFQSKETSIAQVEAIAQMLHFTNGRLEAQNVTELRAIIERFNVVHQESAGLRYVLNGEELRKLQVALDQWARRVFSEIESRQPRTWYRALYAITPLDREYLTSLSLPDNPFGTGLGDAIHHERGDALVRLPPTHGSFRLELRLQARSGQQFVVDTSVGVCHPMINGVVDYDRVSAELPCDQCELIIKMTGLTLVGMRMAHASTGTWEEVLVKVDGKPQPVLLWALAAGLRNRHEALALEPAAAVPWVLEALDALTRRDPWAVDPYKIIAGMRVTKRIEGQP